MAGKGKKKEKAKPKEENGDKKKSKKGGGGGGGRGKKSKGKGRGKLCHEDMMTAAAMDNCYQVCHNVQDLLAGRGFAWPEAQKKKKKGRR